MILERYDIQEAFQSSLFPYRLCCSYDEGGDDSKYEWGPSPQVTKWFSLFLLIIMFTTVLFPLFPVFSLVTRFSLP